MFGVSSCNNEQYEAKHSELIGDDVLAYFELVFRFEKMDKSGTKVSMLC